MEEWRDVAGFEGILQVSSHGRFKKLSSKSSQGRSGKERIIPINSGQIRFSVLGEGYRITASRTIYSTFYPDIDITDKLISFIDRDNNNIRLDNLIIISKEERQSRTNSENPQVGFNSESQAKSNITKSIFMVDSWETRRINGTEHMCGCNSEQALKGLATKRRNGTKVGGFTSESAYKAWETKRRNKLTNI